MTFNKSEREQIAPTIFRKKVRLDGLDAPFADRTLWLPQPGETLMLILAYVVCMRDRDVPTDVNDFAIEVNNVGVVASTPAPAFPGETLRLPLLSQTPFTNALPLTLTQSDAGSGTGELKHDLILYAAIL